MVFGSAGPMSLLTLVNFSNFCIISSRLDPFGCMAVKELLRMNLHTPITNLFLILLVIEEQVAMIGRA